MTTITESIQAEVPAAFADREWSEYMHRAFYAQQPAARDEFGEGKVSFEPLDESSIKVTVELEFDAEEGSNLEKQTAEARESLQQTLAGYRAFIEKRCEETNCWTRQ
jgi:hypothetical protein